MSETFLMLQKLETSTIIYTIIHEYVIFYFES